MKPETRLLLKCLLHTAAVLALAVLVLFPLLVMAAELIQNNLLGDRPTILTAARSVCAGAVLTTILAAVILNAVLQRTGPRPKPRGIPTCPACGYDLRGNPAGPCPECGASTPHRSPPVQWPDQPRTRTPAPEADA